MPPFSRRSTNPLTHRTIRHILLPSNLRIRRQIAISRKALINIILHLADRKITPNIRLVQSVDNIASDKVQENKINSLRHRSIEREGSVHLEIIGLGEVGDDRVNGVVSVGAEVVFGRVAWVGGCGLTADETAALL